MGKYSYVIWDWNGTLIDDVPLACELLNDMLRARALPEITVEQYRQFYEHPIRRVYEKAGFDLLAETFAELSQQWHSAYLERLDEIVLQPGALQILTELRARGVEQVILSALPHTILVDSVGRHGVESFFLAVRGLEDSLARSKIENGRQMLEALRINSNEAVLIGDTAHDVETAEALSVDCVLVSRGAEDKERLLGHGYPVFDDFSGLLDHLGL